MNQQTSQSVKIVFFGTSDFSAETLKTLNEKFEIVLAVTQEDQPVGRKQIITASPVAELVAKLEISCLKPSSLKDPKFKEQLSAAQPDLIVVVAYGKIIPAEILQIAKMGALNIHGSLLPKYRGASPIHAALLNGDTETGVTIMLMDEQMDHGAMLLKKTVAIAPDDTFFELERNLLDAAQQGILEAIPLYINGDLPAQEQDHSAATFCGIIKKQDGKINWQDSAEQIFNKYRAYIRWPEIFCIWQAKILKIKKCALADVQQPNSAPGKVFELNGKIFVSCGEGALELQEIQLEGSSAMSIADFIRGRKDFVGSILE